MLNRHSRDAVEQRLKDGNIREKLLDMMQDPALMVQEPSFSTNSTLYPGGQMPFVDKHLTYLMEHPKLDHAQYLSNLRLKLRKR